MKKKITLLIIICIAITSVAVISVEQRPFIDITADIGETKFVKITKTVDEITLHELVVSTAFRLKPQMTFTPTNQESSDITEIIYEKPYYTDVIQRGTDDYLRLFVPTEYYINNCKYTPSSVVIRVYFEPETVYSPSGYTPSGEQYDYVIITNETFYTLLNQDFMDWKVSHDSKISTILMVNVSDITDNSSFWVNGSFGDATNTANGNHWIDNGDEVTSDYDMFNDTQAKIRNFLRYCYDNHTTRYCLIAGNKDVVPPRMA